MAMEEPPRQSHPEQFDNQPLIDEITALKLIESEKFNVQDDPKWADLERNLIDEIYRQEGYLFEVYYVHINPSMNIENANLKDKEKIEPGEKESNLLSTSNVVRVDKIKLHSAKEYSFDSQLTESGDIMPIVVFRPDDDQPHPVIIHTHGGPDSLVEPGEDQAIFAMWARMGYVIVAPNYRGSNISKTYENLLEGHIPEYPIQDLQATIKFIKNNGHFADRYKIILTGISYGSYLNSLALPEIARDLVGVILSQGFYSIKDSSRNALELILNLPTSLPILVTYGLQNEKDSREGEIYLEGLIAAKKNVKFFIAPQGGHHIANLIYKDVPPFEIGEKEAYQKTLGGKSIKKLLSKTKKRYNVNEIKAFYQIQLSFVEQALKGAEELHELRQTSTQTNLLVRNFAENLKQVAEERRIQDESVSLDYLNQASNAVVSPTVQYLKLFGEREDEDIGNLLRMYLSNIWGMNFTEEGDSRDVARIKNDQSFLKKVEYVLAHEIKLCTQNPHTFILYHAASPENAFIYNFYTEWRRLYTATQPVDVKILRILDNRFAAVWEKSEEKQIRPAEEFLSVMRKIEQGYKNRGEKTPDFNYLPTYVHYAISANMFLLTNPPNGQTPLVWWYSGATGKAQNETEIIQQLIGNTLQVMGITDVARIERYINLFERWNEINKGGSLFQIAVPYDVIDRWGYVSETLGVEFKWKGKSILPSTLIQRFLENPMSFENTLQTHKKWFQNPRKEKKYFENDLISLLQIRFIPGFMVDPEHTRVKIIEYPRTSNDYLDELRQLIVDDISLIAGKGAPKSKTIFQQPGKNIAELTNKIQRYVNPKVATSILAPNNDVALVAELLKAVYAGNYKDLQSKLTSVSAQIKDEETLQSIKYFLLQFAEKRKAVKGMDDVIELLKSDLEGREFITYPYSKEDMAMMLNLCNSSIPGNFKNLNEVNKYLETTNKTISLSAKKLKIIPESIALLTALRRLDLSKNQLSELPESIGLLTALSRLDLSGNQLSALPESIAALTDLRTLDLSNNHLSKLTEVIGALTALRTLNLSNNHLLKVPESIGALTLLHDLDLSVSEFTSLPESIGDLAALQTLNLNQTRLVFLPESIGKLRSLQTLDLSNSYLMSLPESIGALQSVQTLNLDNISQLEILPESIGNLQSLQTLTLNNMNLKSLPESIGNLHSLQTLEVTSDMLSMHTPITLPESFGKLQSLQTLIFNQVYLRELPKSFGNLVNLQVLQLRRAGLARLPKSFSSLKNLRILDLSGNILRKLPKFVSKFRQLTELKLIKNTGLVSLPGWLADLPNLVKLSVNETVKIPDKVRMKQGLEIETKEKVYHHNKPAQLNVLRVKRKTQF